MANFQTLITFLTLLASICMVQGRYYTTLARRQDPSTPTWVSLELFHAMVLIFGKKHPGVLSAYSAYEQICGSDMDAYAYSLLPAYEASLHTTVQITDAAFMTYINDFGDGIDLSSSCGDAHASFDFALDTMAGPATAPLTASPSGTGSSPPASTSKDSAAIQQSISVLAVVVGMLIQVGQWN
ncbi:hypothetical protein DFH07DRAFT_780781 [Mycena maculata]|uniref:Uncharacterized protein n=1 Tax=Mycena maculata TaxID=230809 RepID=A0AAD7MU01_9AGAR|nr:hypothetical protein DFH07DRAFT_780781 [Mycena maculata]